MRDAILKLESIRDDQRDKYYHHLQGRVRMGAAEARGSAGLMGQRPFVKEVVGINHAGRPIKKDVVSQKSYVEARNDIGSRGVYYWYRLRHGSCYFVQEQISRRNTRKYYAIIIDGRIMEINEGAAIDYVASSILVLS